MPLRRLTLLVLVCSPIALLVVLTFRHRQDLRSDSAEAYDSNYASVVSEWRKKRYIPIHPLDKFVRSFSNAPIAGEELLDEQQFSGLTNSLIKWFAAYSSGVKEDFLAFRFPDGVAWNWKNGAMTTMSNYFLSGIIFSSPDIQDYWIGKYGSPDRLASFAPYAELAESWSPTKVAEVRGRWIEEYGVGNPEFVAPKDAMEMWCLIANDHAGGNWFSNFWTGVCLEEGIVRVSSLSEAPEPLENFHYLKQEAKDNGYGVNAWFPNQGYSRMDRANTSFVEWKLKYNQLLGVQNSILIADVFFFVNCSPPDDPQPMLLRLTFVSEANQWVPTEMIQGNIVKTRFRLPFF